VLNLDGVTAIPSDITQPRLGLSEEWIDTERGRAAGSTFFHFASSLCFEENNKSLIYDHNINGVKHAVDVASALRCDVFFYISTAFTVGIHEGHVAEQLHRPAAFNNYYEETKCAAEHLITGLCDAKGLRLVIVRPSVMIGPSESCKTGGSKTGKPVRQTRGKPVANPGKPVGKPVRQTRDRRQTRDSAELPRCRDSPGAARREGPGVSRRQRQCASASGGGPAAPRTAAQR
jgi:nucleoside-diphosphate-sugar epimerase